MGHGRGAGNPSFVLVPNFSEVVVNDEASVSDQVKTAVRLIDALTEEYSIDTSRLYTTGQSMGCMTSLYLNSKYPDLFAASLFVSGQWDISVLEPLENASFFYITAAGDEKASGGQDQVMAMFDAGGIGYSYGQWSAQDSEDDQSAAAAELIAQGHDANFIRFGGMPAISETGLDQKKVHMLLDGIYSAVVVRDILERGRRKEQRAITDALLLRKIILFLSDNIGNNTSIRSIGNTLVTEGLLEEGNRKSKPAVQTISAYIDALLESYIFYEVKRFDIKGKDYLRTLGKYYIVDTGLRNYLLGDRGGDTGHLLENIIYLELFRRGYDVAIGKLDDKEIDFIATSNGPKRYIQVTETMSDSETRKRELAPLMAVQDNYEKVVITMDQPLDTDINGIKIVNALDFLLDGETQ